MLFRTLILRGWWSDPLRALTTLLAVALGVALVLAIDLANAASVDAFAESVNLVSHRVNLQILALTDGFDEHLYPPLLDDPAIRSAEPVLEAELTLSPKSGDPFSGEVLHVLGTDLAQPLPVAQADGTHREPSIDTISLLQGDGALISPLLAQRLHVRRDQRLCGLVGDRRRCLQIAGVLPRAIVGVDSSVVFVDIATAQEMTGRIGRLDRIDLEVEPTQLEGVRRRLAARLPPSARVLTPQSRDGEIQRMLASFALNLDALAAIALLVGGFLLFNTVTFSVVRRRKEIGILRASGLSRRGVLALFLGEGAMFGALGGACGLLLGAAMARLTIAAVGHTVASIYVSSHNDALTLTPLPFCKAWLLGLFVALLATLGPACEAALQPPVGAIRTAGVERRRPRLVGWAAGGAVLLAFGAAAAMQAPRIADLPILGYFGGVLAIFAGVGVVPLCIERLVIAVRRCAARSVPILLAATSIEAAQRRTSIAVASLLTALAMVTSITILVASFRTTVVAWTHDTLRADLYLRPLGYREAGSTLFSPDAVPRLQRLPGLSDLNTFRSVTIPFRDRLTSLAATEFAAVAQHRQLRFLTPVDLAVLCARMQRFSVAVVSQPFAERFAIHVGDAITVPTPTGALRLSVAAIYNDYSSDGGVAMIDRSLFVRRFRSTAVNSIALYALPTTDLWRLRSEAVRALAPLRVDISTTRELRAYVTTVFDRTFAITSALEGITSIVAMLGVVGTLFALVLEQRREIGMLRMLGLSRTGVRMLLLIEAALIALLAGVVGLAVGLALAYDLVRVIDPQTFGWWIEMTIPWGHLFGFLLCFICVTALAGLIPAQWVARLTTGESLREE